MSFRHALIARTATVDTTPPNTIRAMPGSFRLDGQNAALTYVPIVVSGGSVTMQAGVGTFAMAGEDMTPIAGWAITAGKGDFALAGQAANLMPPAAPATIWNNLDKSSTVTLSGSPLLTAGFNNNSSAIVRSVASHNSGKYYFEWVKYDTSNFLSCGLANAAHPLDGQFLGGDTNGFIYTGSGNAFINSIPYGSWVAWGVGDTIGLAIDLTAKKIWGRVNGGNWNNDVLANQNPATGTGGMDLSPMAAGPYFAAAFDNSGGVPATTVTVDFGQNGALTRAPAGFVSW